MALPKRLDFWEWVRMYSEAQAEVCKDCPDCNYGICCSCEGELRRLYKEEKGREDVFLKEGE